MGHGRLDQLYLCAPSGSSFRFFSLNESGKCGWRRRTGVPAAGAMGRFGEAEQAGRSSSGRGPAGAARSKGTAAADDSVYADRLASGKTDTQLGAAAIDI